MAFWTKDPDLADLPLQLSDAGAALEDSVAKFERGVAKVALRRGNQAQRVSAPPPRRPGLAVRRPHARPPRTLKAPPLTVLQQQRLRDGGSPALRDLDAARIAAAIRSRLLRLGRGLDRARRRTGGIA